MNLSWLIDGWHYAFLQPVNKAAKNLKGKTVKLKLYTIAPDKTRYYIGLLKAAELISHEQSKSAASTYRKNGWLDEMKTQVGWVGGRKSLLDEGKLSPIQVFNVRFRVSDAVIFMHSQEVGAILPNGADRYLLYKTRKCTKSGVSGKHMRTRGSSLIPNSTSPVQRSSISAVTVDPIEKIMQNEIYDLLTVQYLTVEKERDFIDFQVKSSAGTLLIEVKSNPNPIKAIRAALGQILEYAFYHRTWYKNPKSELVIIGQGPHTASSQRYVAWLKKRFKLPLQYVTYIRGSKSLNFAWNSD